MTKKIHGIYIDFDSPIELPSMVEELLYVIVNRLARDSAPDGTVHWPFHIGASYNPLNESTDETVFCIQTKCREKQPAKNKDTNL